jgi:hypothetical protein
VSSREAKRQARREAKATMEANCVLILVAEELRKLSYKPNWRFSAEIGWRFSAEIGLRTITLVARNLADLPGFLTTRELSVGALKGRKGERLLWDTLYGMVRELELYGLQELFRIDGEPYRPKPSKP